MISDPTLGALYALGAALAWSVTSLLARSVIAHYGSVTINAVRSGIAGTLLVIFVLLTEGPAALVTMSWTTFALLISSIVIAIAVGDTVFFESTRAIGLGRMVTRLPKPNDGVVCLDETKFPALRDHLALPLGHSLMLVSSRVARQTAAFLKTGAFRR